MSRPIPKRRTLRDELDRIEDDGNGEELLRLVEELEEVEEAAKGFRWHAPLTQSRQDHHKTMYLRFIKTISRLPEGHPESEVEKIAFPTDDDKLLFKHLRMFLIFIFKRARPRAFISGDHIAYRSLAQYRSSLMFWVLRAFDQAEKASPPKSRIFNQMTEAMRYIQRTEGGGPKERGRKTYLGLEELRQLIDAEMFQNRCIENSEQHQLAWCMGRFLAVRPSLLCPGKSTRGAVFCWRNLEFSVGDQPGMFDALFRFDNIAIKIRNDPEVQESTRIPLEVTVTSPRLADNLVFSIPHRLLVIALRRNLLVGISDIPQLMNASKQRITIDPDHLDDPVFYRSAPKGDKLDPPHPLKAGSLTEVLQSRALNLGYEFPVSFYSLRRRAATDLVRRVGLETTRQIMGHSPESRTLERYYLQLGLSFDVTAVGSEQPIAPGGHASAILQKSHSLALTKLDSEFLVKTRGAAVHALAARMMRIDPDQPPSSASGAEMKNYRRRIACQARRLLLSKSHEAQKATLTVEQYRDRLTATAGASRFAQEILAQAGAALQEEVREDEEDDELATEQDDEGLFMTNGEVTDEGEADLDTAAAEGTIGNHFTVPAEGDVDEDDESTTAGVDYRNAAIVFMETLMDNTMSNYATWSQDASTCPLCDQDETMSDKDRSRIWDSQAKLLRHMESNVHSGFKRWQRLMHKAAAARKRDGDTKPFECPYCPTGGSKFTQLPHLARHMTQPKTWKGDEADHERKMEDDGWFDEDWEPGVTHEKAKEKAKEEKRTAEELGVDIVEGPTLVAPQMHESIHGVVRGQFDLGEVSGYRRHLIRETRTTHGPRIPPHLESLIQEGDYEFTAIPQDLRSELKESSTFPGLDEEEND